MTGYAGYPGREASDRLHRAHVAAALDAEVAAWLGSEAAKPETERTNGAVALAALAEQVGPS